MCHQHIWYIILTKNSMMINRLAGEISNWLDSALSFYLLVGWNPWILCYDCEYSSHMPATAAHLRYFTRFCCLEIRVTCMLPEERECHSQLSTQSIHSFSFTFFDLSIIVVTIIVFIHVSLLHQGSSAIIAYSHKHMMLILWQLDLDWLSFSLLLAVKLCGKDGE